MESPGCYWKPVLHILEDDPEYRLAVVLANAQQVKAVTGHKTDPHEARWLAHGFGLSGQLMWEALVAGQSSAGGWPS